MFFPLVGLPAGASSSGTSPGVGSVGVGGVGVGWDWWAGMMELVPPMMVVLAASLATILILALILILILRRRSRSSTQRLDTQLQQVGEVDAGGQFGVYKDGWVMWVSSRWVHDGNCVPMLKFQETH